MGHNLRSHRLVREARAIVGSGALGRIGTLRAAWTSGYHRGGAWPAWRDDRAAGGGAILEIGVHHLDLCSCLLGEPLESVSALLRDGAVPDQDAVVTGRTASGVLVSLLAGQRTVNANEVEIYGEEGALGFSLYRADSLELRRTGPSDLGGGPKARARLLAGRARRLPAAVAAARGGGDFVGSYAAHWRATGEALRGDAPPRDARRRAGGAGRRPRGDALGRDRRSGTGREPVNAAGPSLSVVLACIDEGPAIRTTVAHLARQTAAREIELVLSAPPARGSAPEPEIAAAFAGVRTVEIGAVNSIARANAAGIRAATAPVVALSEDHCFPEPGWAAALIDAHSGPWSVVGPAWPTRTRGRR